MASRCVLLLTIHLLCLCSEGSELCSRVGTYPAVSAETAFGFHPAGAGWHSGCFFGEAFPNVGISGWSSQSRSLFWRSCSLISAFSPLLQLKVDRAAASSRGDHPKSGPSGRASITTSKVGTSIRTRSPVRRRCSRWGELSEPKVPLTSSHCQFE